MRSRRGPSGCVSSLLNQRRSARRSGSDCGQAGGMHVHNQSINQCGALRFAGPRVSPLQHKLRREARGDEEARYSDL